MKLLDYSIFFLAAAAMFPVSGSASTVSVTSLSGSISASVEGVSTLSSKGVKAVTQGDYKITDIAVATDRFDRTRIALQHTDEKNETYYLYMTRSDFESAHLDKGQIITASKKPYGVSFKHADADEPFVIVLDDTWIKDLHSHDISARQSI